MATYFFSALASGANISFNPATDKFVFDVLTTAASSAMGCEYGAKDDLTGYVVTFGGKTVYLNGLDDKEISSSNFIFADGSKYLVGDNSAATALDDAANVLRGGVLADDLWGLGGNDSLYGGAGNDWLWGGSGSDLLNGGAGIDTIGFQDEDGRVVVNMLTGTAVQGSYTDTFSGIENVVGTNAADQVIGDGQDSWFNMQGGSDTINGGLGVDGVQYYSPLATTGVNVNLATGVVSKQFNGVAATDSLSSIESIRGTDLADTVVGSAASENFWAHGGNDNLQGGAGNDQLSGGAGNDSLYGGADNDLLYSGAGKDTYDAGSGVDELSFAGDVFEGSPSMGVKVDLAAGKIYNDGFTNFAALATPSYEVATGFEGVTGTALGDYLIGSTRDDFLFGEGGNDTISGGNGDDEVVGSIGSDYLVGGNGDDTIASNYEQPYDGDDSDGFNDIVNTRDRVYGGGGVDDIYTGTAAATIYFQTSGVLNFDYIHGFDGALFHQGDLAHADRLAVSQSSLKIGDGDLLVENAVSNAAFSASNELVFKSANVLSDLTVASEAAQVIGNAASAYAVGNSALFVLDNGRESTIYRFLAADADSAVEANELQLLGVVDGEYHALVAADFSFFS